MMDDEGHVRDDKYAVGGEILPEYGGICTSARSGAARGPGRFVLC